MWSAPSYFCWWVWLALPRPSIFLSSDSWFFHSKKRRRESCRYALSIKGLTSGVAEVRLWKWLPTLCQCARVWEHTWVIWGRCSKRCDFGRRSVRHGCEKRGWRWGQGQSTSHGESGKLPKKEVFFCKNDPSLSRNCALHQSQSFSSHTLVFDFDFCTCLMWVPQVGGRGVALVRGWWGSSEFLLWSGLDQISFGPNCRYHHLILRLTWEVTRVERVVFDDLPQWPQCALAHAMGTQTRSRGGVLHPGMLFFKKGDLQLLH